jgi:hypothetical protein
MILGDDNIYKCPVCNNLIANGSLASGNTFDAIYYSDGKIDAPNNPEFPIFSICKKCDNLLWLYNMEEIDTCFDYLQNEDYKHAQLADFLTISEYEIALKIKAFSNTAEEIWIRKRILWAFNDRIRANEPIFKNNTEIILWEDNCEKYIELLDISDNKAKITVAELFRNLGKFEKSLNILKTIKDPEFQWQINQIFEEIEKENQFVFEIIQQPKISTWSEGDED